MAVSVKGKLVIDTNIFVSYLRAGLHEEWVEGRVPGTSRFLSSIVLFELRLGASDNRRREVITKLIRCFPLSRIVSPSHGVYRIAADLFIKLYGSNSKTWPADRLGPANDLLIAATAYRIGATLITENEKDFSRIADHLRGFRFSLPYQIGQA
jgi:predicted nucleic acid-binding protein